MDRHTAWLESLIVTVTDRAIWVQIAGYAQAHRYETWAGVIADGWFSSNRPIRIATRWVEGA